MRAHIVFWSSGLLSLSLLLLLHDLRLLPQLAISLPRCGELKNVLLRLVLPPRINLNHLLGRHWLMRLDVRRRAASTKFFFVRAHLTNSEVSGPWHHSRRMSGACESLVVCLNHLVNLEGRLLWSVAQNWLIAVEGPLLHFESDYLPFTSLLLALLLMLIKVLKRHQIMADPALARQLIIWLWLPYVAITF